MSTGSGLIQALRLLLSVGGKSSEAVKAWRGKLSAAERRALCEYARFLDERRVFHAPYHMEVVECCIGSLESMKQKTEEALSQLTHPASRAAVGHILDSVRRFLDEWRTFRTPSFSRDAFAPYPARDNGGAALATFFQDLGGLREHVRSMIEMLHAIDSKITAPNIAGTSERA